MFSQNEEYLAHIASDGRKQTVLEHIGGTAARAREFAETFSAGEIGYLCGLTHDLGKYSSDFQRHILGDSLHVDHATAGAIECYQLQQLSASVAVMGHHGGLPDGGTQTDTDRTYLGRLQKACRGTLPDCSAWKREISLPRLPAQVLTDEKELMFFTRMLYSCLTDADFLDTEQFMDGVPRASNPANIEMLWQRLQQHIAGWFPPKNKLNTERCRILKQCIQTGASSAPGLYTLTVPTGGGKTIASLAFALAQAKQEQHPLRRIIYVIPYTSIIEQTADVFRTVLGEENVLEHHSATFDQTEEESSSEMLRLAKATENWDMPVIVTTAVQFFESLFACKSSQCRKLHNLAQSVIIFDEAQMLPLPYLRPCIYAISQLVQNYGVSAILCTATQPALDSVFQRYLPNRKPVEICPPDLYDKTPFQRVTFRKKGKCSLEELAEELNGIKQVLCIVNSRKSAQTLYEKVKGDGCFHLSTLLCPKERRKKLDLIRKRLDDGLECRVISTSLIEAGVDVDFPCLYREEAGLDSILQAAGRCNREGKRRADESIVTIFQSELSPPPVFRQAISAGRYALSRHENPASEEAIRTYFTEWLSLSGDKAQDSHGIMKTMETSLFPFRTVADQFHLIESDTKTVYIPLDDLANELLEERRSGKFSKKLFRRLSQYSVNVYPAHFSALDTAGALERLDDGTAILADMSLYHEDTGLTLEPPVMQGWFI